MRFLKQLYDDFFYSLYPNLCICCGRDLFQDKDQVCLRCIYELPRTCFQNLNSNPVEQVFRGRFRYRAAHSEFHFSKGQAIQKLIHQLKYNGNGDIGIWLGKLMGKSLNESARFQGIDYLIPVPLNAKREFRRGYNQAKMICNGISGIMNIPVLDECLVRARETHTQTKKQRTDRWQNVSGSFELKDPSKLHGRHILLVDDVLTTGATLEACALVLLDVPGLIISIATLAIASK